MENTTTYENGTQSLNVEPSYNGGELMPVNQAENGCTPLEMAASIGITMAVGYGLGKLGELLFDKVIGPAAEKVGNKYKNRKAKKNKNKPTVSEEENVIDGEYTEVDEDPDEDQDEEEQAPEKKVIRGNKAIKNAAKNKRRR